MLTYDIFLTFPLELEKIWKQKTSGVTILWFFVRRSFYVFWRSWGEQYLSESLVLLGSRHSNDSKCDQGSIPRITRTDWWKSQAFMTHISSVK